MQNYLDLMRDIKGNGFDIENQRTGEMCRGVVGRMLQYDLSEGFPAPTTKKLAFRTMVGELLCFLEGATSAERFRERECRIWDANANENEAWLSNPERQGTDDLGKIYGAQARGWESEGVTNIDQLQRAMDNLKANPSSRQELVLHWNPSDLDKQALPACHVLYHLLVKDDRLHIVYFQRSVDTFLGLPFNIASYALLTHILANYLQLNVGTLTCMLSDTHLYHNHFDVVDEQLARTPRPLPSLSLPAIDSLDIDYIRNINMNEFQLVDYEPDSALKAPMAI